MTAEVKKGVAAVELRTILRRRWKVAALALVLPFSCALALALFLPALYQARAVVLVEPATEPGGAADDFSVRIEQLTRENLARPRLEVLAREHHLFPRLSAGAAAAALRNDIDVETQRVEQASGRISVAITVAVRGRDPVQAAEVANALASYYVVAETARQEADADAAAAELGEVRKQLDDEEGRIKTFDDQNLSELPEQVQLHLSSIASLSAQLESLRVARTHAVERLHALQHPAATPHDVAPEAMPPEPAVVDPELAQAEAQLRDLRSRYTEAHPEVTRLERQVASLRARAASAPRRARADRASWEESTAVATRPGEIEAQIAQLDAQERDLQARIASAQQAALNAPRRAHERAALLPEVEAARESYAALLRHYQELALAHGGASRNPFRVFEDAVAPEHAFGPNRPRLAILGLLFALLVAGGAVWLAELVDRTFHSAPELRSFAGLPVIGTIPSIGSTRAQRVARWRVVAIGAAASCAVAAVSAATWFWASGNEALVRLILRRGNP